MIPIPAKFRQPFFKEADDLGGAVDVGSKWQKDGDLLVSKGTDKDIQIPSVRNSEFQWFDNLSVDKF